MASANSVPICTPSAPRASAATIACPEAMPPAAISGSVVACLTCGMSVMVVVSSLPLCPPASKPSATMASTPASSHLRANLLLDTTCATFIPFSCSLPVYFLGDPADVNTMPTCSATMMSISLSISGYIRGTLMPQGLSVASFILCICSTRVSGCIDPAPSSPSPPALLTAEASLQPLHHTMPPCIIGSWMPNNSQILFLSISLFHLLFHLRLSCSFPYAKLLYIFHISKLSSDFQRNFAFPIKKTVTS